MRGRALKNPRTNHTGRRVPLYLYYSLPTIIRASGRALTTDVCVLLLHAPPPGDLPWLPLVSSSSPRQRTRNMVQIFKLLFGGFRG